MLLDRRMGFRFSAAAFLFVGTIGLVSGEVGSADDEPARPAHEKPPATQNAGLLPTAGPELEALDRLVGLWNVIETHFDTHGRIVVTGKGTEEIKWTLDHHVIERIYKSTTGSGQFRAVGMLVYNDARKTYHGVWFDNVSTSGPALVEGEWDHQAKVFTWTLESSAINGSTQRHRVVERFPDEQTRAATTFLLDGAKVIKRLSVTYTRTTPCPSKMRAGFGG